MRVGLCILLSSVKVGILGPLVVLATILRSKEFAVYVDDQHCGELSQQADKDVLDVICGSVCVEDVVGVLGSTAILGHG